MRNRAIAVWLFGLSGLVHADTVYTVNSSLWAPSGMGINGGTVSGTIETDGTIGTLSASDLLSWTLSLNDGIGQTFTLNPGNSAATLTGTATTATASSLHFNYDTPNSGALGYFEIQDTADGWGLWFAVPPSQPLCGITNPNGAFDSGLVSLYSQPITVGTAVPEPSAFLLLASVLTIMGVILSARSGKRISSRIE